MAIDAAIVAGTAQLLGRGPLAEPYLAAAAVLTAMVSILVGVTLLWIDYRTVRLAHLLNESIVALNLPTLNDDQKRLQTILIQQNVGRFRMVGLHVVVWLGAALLFALVVCIEILR